ncbi:MAG TPA: DUF4142 domain-containing protein [Polyangiaceae bacterium]|jgi:putative membrane protein
MKMPMFGFSLAALALTAACGGSDQNTQPQTPANGSTTTTSAQSSLPPDTQQPAPTPGPSPMNGAPTDTMQGMPGSGTPSNTAITSGTANQPDTMSSSPQPGATMGSDTGANDGQIAAVLAAANNGEIDQARVAVRKAKNQRVKQFAEHMVTDHTHAQSKLDSTDSKEKITPQDGSVSAQLKQQGESIMSSMRASNGSDFDRTYMDAQVDEHQKVLDLIDRYLGNVQNGNLKAVLQESRTKVADHLKMAKDIQSSLAK